MIKLFIDTSVVLDTILPGRPFADSSAAVLRMGGDSCRMYLSSMSVATLYYVAEKIVGKDDARAVVSEWFRKNYVLPVSDICVYDALRSDCPDFEDAMQIACADYGDCDCTGPPSKKNAPPAKTPTKPSSKPPKTTSWARTP